MYSLNYISIYLGIIIIDFCCCIDIVYTYNHTCKLTNLNLSHYFLNSTTFYHSSKFKPQQLLSQQHYILAGNNQYYLYYRNVYLNVQCNIIKIFILTILQKLKGRRCQLGPKNKLPPTPVRENDKAGGSEISLHSNPIPSQIRKKGRPLTRGLRHRIRRRLRRTHLICV